MIGMTREMIDVKDGLNETALMLAAEGGHGKIGELLLEKGADVDVRDSFGIQAIHFATSEGHLDVAKLIASKHPKVLTVNTNSVRTPLSLARGENHNHIVHWLQTEKGVTE